MKINQKISLILTMVHKSLNTNAYAAIEFFFSENATIVGATASKSWRVRGCGVCLMFYATIKTFP